MSRRAEHPGQMRLESILGRKLHLMDCAKLFSNMSAVLNYRLNYHSPEKIGGALKISGIRELDLNRLEFHIAPSDIGTLETFLSNLGVDFHAFVMEAAQLVPDNAEERENLYSECLETMTSYLRESFKEDFLVEGMPKAKK